MIQSYIDDILGPINIQFKKETFNKYEIEFHCQDISQYLKTLNNKNYTQLNNYLSNELGYKWDLIIDDLSYSISQDNFQNFTLEEIDETENVLVRFNIYKSGHTLLIIDNDLFNQYLSSSNLYDLLTNISLLENEFTIVSEVDDFELKVNKDFNSNEYISKQCSFRNIDSFFYSPETFYFEDFDIKSSSLIDDTIIKLSLVYSLIYLFDYSEIKDDDLHLIISGSITYKYVLPFNKLKISELKHYYQIYKWVYNDKAKVEDKIGLVRNILASYLTESSITINDSVFSSILSSNLIYVRGNISKYFEVRNKIVEQIEGTVSKVNQSIDTFFNSFQKSIFVFISFFLTVYITKILSKAQDNIIFTKETSILGIGFILLSVIFLIFSLIMLFIDKNRIDERYTNVKNRFKDVLTPEDIENILNDDFEYKNEISYFKKRTMLFASLWILAIILFIVLLFYTSEYLDFDKVWNYIFSKS